MNLRDEKVQALQKRLKEYALRIIRLYESLRNTARSRFSHQLLRSGTSPGAQYREPADSPCFAARHFTQFIIRGGFAPKVVGFKRHE